MSFKINGINIVHGPSELKEGFKYNDFSRVSFYGSNDSGGHTGANSPTIGRHNNLSFGNNSGERQTTLAEFGINAGFIIKK